MSIPNLDYQCYLEAVTEHRRHQEDWLVTGYAPRGFYLKDFCHIRASDGWHLFHIAGTPGVSCCLPGNEIWFGHATTTDFLSWETHSPCFYLDPAGWDNGHVFAPYVIEHDSKYWMFYTGCALDNTQRIGAAVSDDLHNWTRVGTRPVIRPEEYGWAFCPATGGSACRDPHVCRFGDEYWLYYTAVTQTGRGAVGLSVSKDLIQWEDRGPVFQSGVLAHCESSNVQELDGKYLLFFGGHYEYWSYVVSDNPAHWPDQEPRPLMRGITGMEVVARACRRWLVSYFRFDALRLFLGIIDWDQADPKIEPLTLARALNEFEL